MRWMNGSCIEAPAQRLPNEDEPYVFSFYSDISANPDIIVLVQSIQNSMKATLTTLTRYLTKWKKFKGIWKSEKVRSLLCCR